MRTISCKKIDISQSARVLKIIIRTEATADMALWLLGLPYAFICLKTLQLIPKNPLFLVIFLIEILVANRFELRRNHLYSNYEIWEFEENILRISQLKSPQDRLERMLLRPLPLKQLPPQTIEISDIEKVGLERSCNDGGYFDYFVMTAKNQSVLMHSSAREVHLLENAIKRWLNKK